MDPFAYSKCWDEPDCFISLSDAAIIAMAAMQVSFSDLDLCESPIERQLGHRLLSQLPSRFALVPQYEWRRFRIDFAICFAGYPVAFIECDGKEFHSSPEQIARDRHKDQVAAMVGISMLRFSGSEIYRDAYACAASVFRTLDGVGR